MKNALTPSQGTAAVSEPWRAGAAHLRRRPAATRRRRAHPQGLRHRRRRARRLGDRERARPRPKSTTRPCAAGPPGSPRRARRPRTMARKLASHPQPLPQPARARPDQRQPGRPAARARSSRTASRRRSSRRTSPTCSTRSRPRTPLEQRDRALFELAYCSGLRAEELVDLDIAEHRLRPGAGARRGQGLEDPLRPRRRARRCKSIATYLERARPALQSAEPDPALFLSKSGRRLSTSDVRRRLRVWARHAATHTGVHPHALRHSFATHLLDGRRGPARDPGDARSRKYLDDPGLHSGRVRPPPGGVREEPPTGLRGLPGDQRQSDRVEGAVDRLQDGRLRQGTGTTRRRVLTTRQVRRRPDVLRACLRMSKRPT